VALSFTLMLCACTTPLTEIIVIIDSELDIPADIDDLIITVEGASGLPKGTSARLTGTGSASLPATLGLRAADGNEDGPVSIQVRGRQGGAERIVSRVSTRFIAGQRLLLRIDLSRSCVGIDCTEGDTCRNGRCVADAIDPSELPIFTSVPPTDRPDGSVDAGPPDAPTDAGPPDAPMDAGPLGAPTEHVASSDAAGGMTFAWTAPDGAASYELEMSENADFASVMAVADITETNHTATGLPPGARLHGRVRAHAADGRVSEWSNVATAITQIAAPATPSVSVSIDGNTRHSDDGAWVDPPTTGTWFYAQGRAQTSCPGSSVQYRFQVQYTGDSTIYGWTGWMGPDAFTVQPLGTGGVRFWAQARCVGRDAASGESGVGGACLRSGGGGC